jgi:RNA-binding protein NOB1
VNGKPPGKTDATADEPNKTETEDEAVAQPDTTASEATEEQGDAVPQAADESGPSGEQATSQSVTEQLQDLSLNQPAAEENTVDDEEEVTEEEDDGEGEWISGFCRPSPSHCQF